jgi:hypothetical protein
MPEQEDDHLLVDLSKVRRILLADGWYDVTEGKARKQARLQFGREPAEGVVVDEVYVQFKSHHDAVLIVPLSAILALQRQADPPSEDQSAPKP